MDSQKFKGNEEDLRSLDLESLDQAAGGSGEIKIVCLNCGSTNTVRASNPKYNPINPRPWVWKCLDCGLTDDEWLKK